MKNIQQRRRDASSRRVDPSGMVHDDSIVEVGVATEVRLLSVNDAEETFKVALLIHCHYKLPMEMLDDEQREKWSPKPNGIDGFERRDDFDAYSPTMTMVNCVETQFEDFEKTVRFNEKEGIVWVSYYNTCNISESLELENFPFDRQLFRVIFKSADAKLRQWSIDPDVLDFPKVRREDGNRYEEDEISTYLVACELKSWFMKDFFVEYFPDDDDPASLSQGEFAITIQAERDPMFYFFNFYFVMYLIVLTNVTNISVSPQAAGERHALTITLLLTLVAFKFVLVEGVPKVGYLTYMDKYVLLSYVFTMAAVMENIFVAPLFYCKLKGEFECFFDDEAATLDVKEADDIFHTVFFVLWTFVNLVVAVYCFFPSLIRMSWEKVIDGQIGTTDDTVKRTFRISNGNQNEEEKLRRLGIPVSRRRPNEAAEDLEVVQRVENNNL